MTVLVFGRTGQVAQELQHALAPRNDVRFIDRTNADLAFPDTCTQAIEAIKPAAIINAAAYTAVDQAEAECDLAMIVNGDAPGAMARAAARLDIPFLQISSDYVFTGHGEEPFTPLDTPAPLSAYGRSKLEGERQIRDAGGRWLILRTSWVFSSTGRNFLRTVLRLGGEQHILRVVDDQIGGPTPASAIAEVLTICLAAIEAGHKGGLYHLAGAPDVSWAEFAEAIITEASLKCRIERIPSIDYPTPAPRPRNSRLDCTSLQQEFGIARPDWRTSLLQIIEEIFP